jgi:MFS family permease
LLISIRRGRDSVGLADWRDFAAPRHRTYHLLALCQGIVMILAGFDVIIPFALEMGCPPAFAALLGALPVAGGMAQLFVPPLLARTDGNLRRLTLLFAAAGETRGVLLALLAIAVAAGLVNGVVALVLLAVLIGVTGVLGAVTGANLLAWHSAVLEEADRRLIVPRLMGVSLAIGAILLLPIALLLDDLASRIGMVAYALPFAIAGAFGIAELIVIRRLPVPGRMLVPARALEGDAPESPAFRQFLRVSALNALGMGVAPYMSVYAMAVLGLSAGFAMTLGVVSALTMVVAATVAGSMLTRGSSARMLRGSFWVRAAAMAVPIAALPGSILAPWLLYLSAMLGAVGFANGQLAANERLYRLISGPAVIRQHGRYLARTSSAMTVGQVGSGMVLAVGAGLGYPIFALLYGASSGLRLLAHRAAAPERLGEQLPTVVMPLMGATQAR